MPTSSRSNRSQRGVTLLEMLVTLAIMSMAAGIAASAIAARSPRLHVDREADALVIDLKRLRLIAETSGAPVELVATAEGYAAPDEGLAHQFPSDLRAVWNGENHAKLTIASGLSQTGAEIRLTLRNVDAVVTIAPMTGRVTRVR